MTETMMDKNGTPFEVGAALQSTQSVGEAGIINCIAIHGNTATFTRDRFGEDDFKINQDSLNSSEWVVLDN